jgi:peptide-methionine (S)-S-oxide reductase
MRQRLFLVLLIGLSIFSDAKETVMKKEIATLGGGCFWCLEAVFEETRGVLDVVSGYAGGDVKHPSYAQVSGGKTNHAEVVQIHFDSDVISFEEILKIFWLIHDPTTLNAQGNDVGTQYRSVIFYHDAVQHSKAQISIKEFSAKFLKPIVTQLLPLPTFYEAEGYHQNYFKNNPNQGYCSFVVAPKVEKFKQVYKEMVK